MSASKTEVVDALRSTIKERDRLLRENRRLLVGSTEPIAIVGMACRYPGEVASPRELWELVAEGRDGITGFPTDRGWPLERLYDPDLEAGPERLTSYTREGGFLHDSAEFDPAFFGISPREALAMDPQQRLLLEVSWQALEDAGIDPGSLHETQTGVFAGVMYQDYGLAPGMTQSLVSGRIAYTLGLEGPAVTIDTACSSSLVAMHLAAGALRQGECSLALAGGVSVLGTPAVFVEFSRQGGLSPDGRSKSFADSADGVGWAEGVGVLALQRLSDAKRDGNRVLALLRGSAVNQDGASNGFTAPNGPAQERVIRRALANARLKPTDIDAVEAHGTGTTLGDPIEAGALLATYGQDRENGPLKLGSLKSNIGHTQAAAGVGGVIKMVQAMREGVLPKTLHLDAPSSKVDWETGEIELLSEAVEWKPNGHPRRAGVSSFGVSGTNAHVILEEAPEPELDEQGDESSEAPQPPLGTSIALPLSAKSEGALAEVAANLATHLKDNPELDLKDVAYSLATTRSAFEHRAVALGSERKEMLGALKTLAEGKDAPSSARGRAHATHQPVFLFPGQGAQSQGMAAGLIESSAPFARQIEACEGALSPHVDWSLTEVLRAEDAKWLDRLDIVQPALFAVMVSLAGLWRECGVQPQAVVGHSQGEIAAAHIAGVLSLEDSALIVAERGKAMAKIAGQGGMLSVSLTPEQLSAYLEPLGERVSLAAINGPASLVLSGDPDGLDEIGAALEEDELRAKRIAVDYAAHSAQIEDLREELLEAFAPISPQSAQIPLHSTVTAEQIDGHQMGPEYWYRNLRQTVLLEPVIRNLLDSGKRAFIEISPHPVLSFGAEETIEDALSDPTEATLLSTLRREEDEPARFALSLAEAHASGVELDFQKLYPGAKRVPLPTYPFQRERFWISAGLGPADASSIGLRDADHPLLGAAIEDPSGEGGLSLTGALSLATHPWLADHVVLGNVLLPGTAFLELALHAAELLEAESVEELTLRAPLILPRAGAVSLQVSVSAPDEQGSRSIEIHSRTGAADEEGEWTLHAAGSLGAEVQAAPEPLGSWPPEGAEPLGVDHLDELFAEVGLEYGPAFQGLGAAWTKGEQIYAEVSLPEEHTSDSERFAIHPALLDAALHAIALASGGRAPEAAQLPFSWGGVSLLALGAKELRVCLSREGEAIALRIADGDGAPVATVKELAVRPLDPAQLQGQSQGKEGLLDLRWQEVSLGEQEAAPAEVEALYCESGEGPNPKAAHDAAQGALEAIQRWLADESNAERRLALVTEGAIATTAEEPPDLAAAAIWGLIRSAQSEHPGRFSLIDIDGSGASAEALSGALAIGAEEPQLALREGQALVPRLARVEANEPEEEGAPVFDSEKTVLITGGLSGLGALTARHLVERHGVRHLLLVSRSGKKAKGAKELEQELGGLGAEVEIAACDVADREQLKQLLSSTPNEHPLGAIVHAAGVLDDGLIADLNPGRLSAVMTPKADAAHHLHELTKDADLSAFVLFSSVAGTFGAPGQANYAAANSFLDALAQRREAEGRPATSIAWGLWARESEMTSHLSEADLTRMERGGIEALSDDQGLELFDAAIDAARPQVLGVPLNRAALRAAASAGALTPLFSGLVRVPRRRSASSGQLAAKLATLPETEREAFVSDLVRAEVAAVLGHTSARDVEPDRAFKDLGFESLTAVELRNRLNAVAGVRLPATVVFDYPSSRALAAHLLSEASAGGAARQVAVRAQASEEPIAIVGMACRYPDGASSPEELWKLVAEGRDAIGQFPADRGWPLESRYDPDTEAGAQRLTTYTRNGGFLYDSAEFDPAFFRISPREALTMDPQQRLLLEASWQALEDAGIDPGSLAQSQTGVFAGVMYQDYGPAPGMTQSLISGRLAYTLGLEGPAMTVDTACSSSLVAMHLAAQALRSGECSLALAGGVTVLATPAVFVEFSRQRGLAPDGRCKAFAEAADGTGFSEGVGVLALQRLSDAQRDGNRVLAIVKGSAVNQDGASNGLTAPNGPSQERVIRQALANARLEPKDIDAVEAHGTGTTLGDPIEAGALLATYGQDREKPLKLGSIKSNIGHTQAAAGVAGVIKMVEAMRAGVLPKTLHLDAPSSKVDWEAGEIELLSEAVEWKPNGHPRRAGVSSFGASGTNAHVILEEAPGPEANEAEASEGEGGAPTPRPLAGPIALPLSAKSEPALAEAAANLAAHLKDNPELDLGDVAYSLATTRALFEHRAVALGQDRNELIGTLEAIGRGETPAASVTASAKQGKLACLFTGQGAQRAAMGKELYAASPAFAKALDEACEALDPHLSQPLKELLFAKGGSKKAALLDQTATTQPALFAIEVALFRLTEALGLKPDYLAGHSIGELVAAHIAGVLSLKDAAKLIAARGALMGELPSGGAMIAIEATEAEVAKAIEGKGKELSIAAINGPSSVVISGKEKAALEIQAHFEELGQRTKRLSVSHAFHSPLIEPMLEDFAKVAGSIEYHEPKIPILSNLSGELLSSEQATDPAYWVRHVREPVRFADGVASLEGLGVSTYLELGPDGVLTAMATTCLPEDSKAALIPTLREGRPEAEAIASALANAHASGAKLDFQKLYPGAKRVPLPTYPFQRERFWLSAAAGPTDASSIGQGVLEHPLLAALLEDPDGERLTLTGALSLSTHPWLADHKIAETVLLPGTAFLELALKAAEQVDCESVAELTLQAPLVLPESQTVAIQVTVSGADQQGNRAISIHSRPEAEGGEGEWTQNAQGSLSPEPQAAPEPLQAWPPQGAEPIEVEDLYDLFAEAGFQYGPAFQGLNAAWRAKGGEIYAEVALPEQSAAEAESFAIHPALLDSALHAIALGGEEGSPQEAQLPFSWSGVGLMALGARELRVCLTREGDAIALGLTDGQGAPLGTIAKLAIRPLDPALLQSAPQGKEGLLSVQWQELSLGEQEDPPEQVEPLHCQSGEGKGPQAAQEATQSALGAIQEWLGDEQNAERRLALITKGALATTSEESPDPAQAAIWGLVRSAQSEHPGRFSLIDTDASEASLEALNAALAHASEPQLALREGQALAPRALELKDSEDSLIPPVGPWHLDTRKRGTLESLALLPSPRATEPLGPTEVRIQMRAAGLNFRDVLVALGLYPGEAQIGGEGAGVVAEVGSEVSDLAPGERVMGLIGDSFGPLATSERDLLAKVPESWSFEQAAALPIVFATAYYGLKDLANLKAGERVLIHAGAGGVGMAAIGIAQHLGAEVFATASPAKWELLDEMGIEEDHIASSRDLDFKDKFSKTTAGKGVDVVLNALTGEFVDASLALLPRGGRFLEIGKTDIRDKEQLQAEHEGVSYLPFDLIEAGPKRIGQMLTEIAELIEQGELHHSPIATWDVRRAPGAFRHLREGKNVGKVVLGIPRPIDPDKTILITGATSGLGALFARHLTEHHGAKHLLLVSRSGSKAKGAKELRQELGELGAKVKIAACDVADERQLKGLLAKIPKAHPLGAIVHAAGVLDDGLIADLDPERLKTVMAPKAKAAHLLHELTKEADLSAFVLFSSVAATLGAPGQGNYAAANSFLDALAQKRQTEGRPATSIAWGLWARQSTMTAELSEADLARMGRGGIQALSEEQGIKLFDAALGTGLPQALAVPLDRKALRAAASAGALPPLFSGLVKAPRRASAGSGQLAAKLATLPEAEREGFVADLVRSEVAAVLGHASAQDIDPDKAFKDLGFDSLAAVELRNRLVASTAVQLPATAVFDYPNSNALAAHLLAEASASGAARQVAVRAQASEEPIAIVGMACRYPGGVASPAELWQLLAEGRDGITEFPADRGWPLERLYDPDPDHSGTSYTREGGFLHDSAEFDAAFFGISPREAVAMDPQQRLLLEASWQALEEAGIDPVSLRGGPAGVFAGLIHQDYLVGTSASLSESEGYAATGSTASVASGRVSYTLGLEGPAMTVDTACSSSLVAMHLAAQALRSGECSLALAGGVTVLATPAVFVEFSRQRGLAPDGRSKSFAEAADGVGWSEGVGVLALQRLSDARREGNEVLAILKGSAVNQDGASNGLTAPNGPSQERVIRQALANARLEPRDIDAVEAHGTGTTLGDPIEAGALLATYGQDREKPLKLGSIKSNIGHTQAAAGVAGVIKMVEAMRAGVLPKTLHLDAPSSKVDWEAGEIELLSEAVEWQPNGHPRRAGVSSFGISGTNAHVILEEAPEPSPAEGAWGAGEDPGASSKESEEQAEAPQAPLAGPIALPLSAKSEPALAQAAERLATHLKEHPEQELTDVAYSLTTTRALFEQRAVAFGSERNELIGTLEAIGRGETPAASVTASAKQGKLACLFTGQGAQRAAMGKELYAASPAFAKALDEACEALDPHLSQPLKELLFAKGGSKKAALLDQTATTQPALFAIEVALFRFTEQLGLKPDYLAGHSIGELSAAHIAGVLSLKDAAKLIAARGALMGELPSGGAMIAIEATEAEVAKAIEGKGKVLSIAAINGPSSVVISGKEKAALEIQAHFEELGQRTKRLSVSHAFHSPLIEPMLEDFAKVAGSIEYHEPKIPILSNLSGELLSSEQATDPAYWVRHVREPVRFADGVASLEGLGVSTYLELGPDGVLTAMATTCLPEDSKAALIPTLREGRPEAEAIASALANAHASGAKLDFQKLYPGAKRVPLPTYPFQRERFWLSAAAGPTDASSIGQGVLEHPLLAALLEDPDGERLTLTGALSLSTHPWLADHKIAETVLLPGTAFLELALKAAEQVDCESVAELTLQAPLVLPESQTVAIQVTVSGADQQGNRAISIHSRPEAEGGEGEWTQNAQGSLSPEPQAAPEPLQAWPPQGAEPIEVEDLYDLFAEAGFQYGPAFQGLNAAWRAKGGEIYAEVALPEQSAAEAESFAIHPALLDSALHAIALGGEEGSPQEAQLPFSWSGVGLMALGARELRVRISPAEEGTASLALFDSGGTPLLSAASLKRGPLELEGQRSSQLYRALHRLRWQAPPELPANGSQPSLAIFGEADLETIKAERFPDLPALTEAIEAGTEAPEILIAEISPAKSGQEGLPASARAGTKSALALLQAWLGEERLESSRLALITKGALATTSEESPDPAQAAIWGLVRSAQSEHPGRFSLIDTDASEASLEALSAALAHASEPQLALREGQALVPRLARVDAKEREEDKAPSFDPDKTILITGATSGLGALFARHLTEHHGAKHLLLVSRSGSKAKGAKELRQELGELGAKVKIAACDVADERQLKGLLAKIPKAHPLGAVIHAAGLIDNGLIPDLDPEQIERVFAPKVDGAHHLHELTKEADLSAFVLFSSAAGLLGGPGQGNYAAANSFLDALAQRRQAEGKPATSLAWGIWAQQSTMAGELSEAEIEGLLRQTRMVLGFTPIPPEQGLALFDAAASFAEPLLAPVHFDRAALRARAKAGSLPALLRGLIRVPSARERAGESLSARLATVPEAEREAFVLDFVRSHVAAVLGHASAQDIDPDKAFKDLGFDSLAAVELRNRLVAASDVQLAATMAFDYPSAAALGKYLLGEASASGAARQIAVRAQASEEPIAIVGMSCRYPGGAASPAELWKLVAEGREGITEFPADRGWDLERLYDPDPESSAERLTSYTREGGFLHDSAHFDPAFFGISPREALAMDPQERLLLEASWQALEEAGIDPASLRGEPAGVFAGVGYRDYGPVPGMTQSLISGRVSYTLGLEGPAISIDTACSSSLVAMHWAAQALRSGECSLALAGGVTVLATPAAFIEFSRQRGLAPDGRCKSFAEAADGVGWSEGVGVLALQRLSDAQRQGNRVLAILKGSAVNQDGASNGLTAPNGPSQERVIRQALANARLEPKDIDAVEAHGTGTTLGDPIEAGALLATYGQDRDEPLKLGSIKSNIGHTQAAAGVAGVIKMVEAMRAGVLPKTLHLDAPSSKVDWEAGEIELLSEAVEWKPNGHPRRAGVSSFGISGTNAHVILEEAPGVEAAESKEEEKAPRAPLTGPIALPLSAKSEPALAQAAERLATHLEEHPEAELTDIAHSLATTRALFEHRAVALGGDREELREELKALAEDKDAPGIVRGRARSSFDPVFLFPGQGAQSKGMARGLLESSAAFASHIEACEKALSPHVDWSLAEILREEDAKWLDRLDIVQPALFAVMASLAKLWRECGVEPAAVLGHSQGEIAAAHIVGALSLDDAALVIAKRGKVVAKIAGKGAMLSVSLTPEQLTPYLEPLGERVSLAAINGPASLVLSGDPDGVDEIRGALEKDEVRAQPIAVDYAAHSSQIDRLEEELLEAFASISPQSAQIPLYSTVTAEQIDTQQMGAEYWYRNLRQTVLLEPALRNLLDSGKRAFLEIGPHPVLSFGAQETIDDALEDPTEAILLSTLRREEDEPKRFALSFAQAHSQGIPVQWEAFFKGTGARRVPLPTYPFQRERYWLTATAGATSDPSAIGQREVFDHPMLAAAIEDADGGLLLTGRISPTTHSWMGDHVVLDTLILPGTGFVELALRAGEEVGCETIEELTLQAPMVLSEQSAASLRVSVAAPEEGQKRQISIHSRTETGGEAGEWTLHATGILSAGAPSAPQPLTAWPPEGAEPIDTSDLYERFAEIGFSFGPAFQGLTAAWQDGEEICAEVGLAEDQHEQASRFAIHPALLDSTLHAAMLSSSRGGGGGSAGIPFSWTGVSVVAAGAQAARVRLRSGENELSLEIADAEGAPLAKVDSLRLRPISPEQMQSARAARLQLFEFAWRETPLPKAEESPRATLIDTRAWTEGKDPGEASHALAARALEMVQADLEEEVVEPLLFLTEGALSAKGDDEPNLPAAALAGLLRSAGTEQPGRFALIDTDGSEASNQALPRAIAASATGPQLALREGEAFVPCLAEAKGNGQEDEATLLDPDKTILITGATGGLGALFARHLTERHGARHLLLVSRSGEKAKGAKELGQELRALGAKATIAACDVSDRGQLEELFASIPKAHPMGAVIHAAGVLDDGLVGDLDPERLSRVMAPKADAARHLHELSADLDLDAFILFSSMAGAFGSPGVGNYAAANSFLDALAAKRRREGLPATSIAWGHWERETGMIAALGKADLARMRRMGLAPISDERGLALFDAAIQSASAQTLAFTIDYAGLRAQAAAGTLAPIFGGLTGLPSARARATARREKGWLLPRLAPLAEGERDRLLVEAIRSQVATMMGHASGEDVELEAAFPELGFDSLASLEMRDWLNRATGLTLPVSVLFDYPTTTSLAQHIGPQLDVRTRQDEPDAHLDGPGGEILSIKSLYGRAQDLGKSEDGAALLAIAAKLRPTFDLEDSEEHLPEPIQLASGLEGPRIICIPSLLAVSGPHQYVRFAQHLAEHRNVTAIPIPGFLAGESLPASLRVACSTHAAAIQKCVDGEPYVLLGHSTGGQFAHLVANHLSSAGTPPAGIVKIDTYSSASLVNVGPYVLAEMQQRASSYFEITDHRLTAMIAYSGLLTEHEPEAVSSAGLLIRATDPLPGMAGGKGEAHWSEAETVVDVPGDHFTMMEEHVSHVARVVDRWVSSEI